MKMKLLLMCCMALPTVLPVGAQPIPLGPPGGRVQFQRAAYGFITSLPPAPPATEGHYFLDERWLRGDILLEDSTLLEAMYFRLNLKDQSLEIKDNASVKVLPGKRVTYFSWENNDTDRDGTYWNAGREDTSAPTGFVKFFYKADYSLVKYTSLDIVNATYNAALDVGSKNHQVVQQEEWFIHHDGVFMKVERNRKKFWSDLSQLAGRDCRQLFADVKIDTHDPAEVIPLLKKLSGEPADVP